MTKLILLLCTAGMSLAEGMAQQTGRMETDRPDQTECPFITRKGWIQAETGFSVEQENGLTTLVHPSVLWKYGLSTKFELRLVTEINSVETASLVAPGNEVIRGVIPVKAGGKLFLQNEKGLLPETSLLFHFAPAKLGSKNFHTKKWAADFRFSMQHTLSEKTGLGYNLGAEWNGFDNSPAWIYTIAPGFNLGKNGYAYAELFGQVKKGELPQHSFDGGLAWYLSDNLKADISSGVGISKAASDWYIAAGLSVRFRCRNR